MITLDYVLRKGTQSNWSRKAGQDLRVVRCVLPHTYKMHLTCFIQNSVSYNQNYLGIGPIDGFIPALKSGIDPKAGFSYPGVLGRKAGRWFREIRVARSRDKNFVIRT